MLQGDWTDKIDADSLLFHLNTGCKMQFLGAEYEFCEVCKEQLRKSFCADSNVTKLFFRTYADEFLYCRNGAVALTFEP